MSNFWKFEVSNISKDYKARVSPPKIKYLFQMFYKSIFQNENKPVKQKNKETIARNLYLYPKYGCKGIIDFLEDEIVLNKGKIKKNSVISDLNLYSDHVKTEYIQNNNLNMEVFDKVYWAASILDLSKVLKFDSSKKSSYRKLLTINISINKNDLLGDKVHTSYIMIPNILFHRVYEPNKISPFMTPKNKTSACLEITLDKKINDPTELIDKAINQFCTSYNLNKLEIKYLGYNFYEEAYPLLFVNYNIAIERMRKILRIKTTKISLIGRTGQYFPYNVEETLNSV